MQIKKSIKLAALIAAAALLVMILYTQVISPKLIVPAEQYAHGVKLMEQRRYMEAAIQFEALKDYSNAEAAAKDAWLKAGDAAFSEGRTDEAAACYVHAEADAAAREKVDERYLAEADEAFVNNEPEKAELLLSKIVSATLSSRVDEARLKGAEKTLEEGTEAAVKAAAGNLSRVSENAYSKAADLLAGRGRSLLEAGKAEEAYCALSSARRFLEGGALDSFDNQAKELFEQAAEHALSAGNEALAAKLSGAAQRFASGRTAG